MGRRRVIERSPTLYLKLILSNAFLMSENSSRTDRLMLVLYGMTYVNGTNASETNVRASGKSGTNHGVTVIRGTNFNGTDVGSTYVGGTSLDGSCGLSCTNDDGTSFDGTNGSNNNVSSTNASGSVGSTNISSNSLGCTIAGR